MQDPTHPLGPAGDYGPAGDPGQTVTRLVRIGDAVPEDQWIAEGERITEPAVLEAALRLAALVEGGHNEATTYVRVGKEKVRIVATRGRVVSSLVPSFCLTCGSSGEPVSRCAVCGSAIPGFEDEG